MKVYPICTPLSRFFATEGADCVIQNIKPLDKLTPEDIQAFPARAEACAVKLGLKQPAKAVLLQYGGTSLIKSNRAMRRLSGGGGAGMMRGGRSTAS